MEVHSPTSLLSQSIFLNSLTKTVSVCNEGKITHSIKSFCREELDLSNGAGLPRMLRHSK